jgi:hypothetical protein
VGLSEEAIWELTTNETRRGKGENVCEKENIKK